MCIATWLRHLICWWDHRREAGSLGSKARAAWRRLCTQDWRKVGEGVNARALRDWAGMVDWEAVNSKSRAITLMQQVSLVATKAQHHDSASARTRWLVWIQEGPGKGLGRQHKMPLM